MLKMKLGGMILTGLGAYLIMDKALCVVERTIDRICEARIWSKYYETYEKCGDVKSPDDIRRDQEIEKDDMPDSLSEQLGECANRVMNDIGKKDEKKEAAKDQGDTDGDKELNDISDKIADMVMEGAPQGVISEAIKHSMEVMDAKKGETKDETVG